MPSGHSRWVAAFGVRLNGLRAHLRKHFDPLSQLLGRFTSHVIDEPDPGVEHDLAELADAHEPWRVDEGRAVSIQLASLPEFLSRDNNCRVGRKRSQLAEQPCV